VSRKPADDLQRREAIARQRLRLAARDLKDTVLAGARREHRRHPWTLPAAAFLGGLLVPLLAPPRDGRSGPRRDEPPRRVDTFGLRDAWADARSAAADTLAEALGAAVRRLFSASDCRNTEHRNGCAG
jgi:hypothetical protein